MNLDLANTGMEQKKTKQNYHVFTTVSSRLFCPLRSLRKRDDSRLGRTHIVRGLAVYNIGTRHRCYVFSPGHFSKVTSKRPSDFKK